MADFNSSDSDRDDDNEPAAARGGDDTPPRKRVKQHYKTKWQDKWSSKFPSIKKESDCRAKCITCCRAFSFEHQGELKLIF